MKLAGVSKIDGQHEMEEDATEGYIKTSMVHTKDWSKTLKGVEGYLRTLCGINVTALSYVAKKQLVPMVEADDPLNRYYTIDEEMIEKAPIVVVCNVCNTAALESKVPFTESYLTDKATVWGKMASIFSDSTAWTY